MIKNNKIKFIISSILILLPAVYGFFTEGLSEKIAVHWGVNGKADGFMDPKLFFFLIPALALAMHVLCLVITTVQDKKTEQSKKITNLVFFIIPAMSIAVCSCVFTAAYYESFNPFIFAFVLLAVMFIVLGNYLPKSTRNRYFGIKIKWTLESDENWNATHRFSGKLYVVLGFLCLLAIPLPANFFPFIVVPIIILCAVLPIIYSYRFYKKNK